MKKFYSCAADSNLGKALRDILDKCNSADKAADEWAKKHHATAYVDSGIHMAGGVTLCEFQNEPLPTLWKRAEDFIDAELYEPNVPDDLDLRELKQRQKEASLSPMQSDWNWNASPCLLSMVRCCLAH